MAEASLFLVVINGLDSGTRLSSRLQVDGEKII
jgi:hypothetical protein